MFNEEEASRYLFYFLNSLNLRLGRTEVNIVVSRVGIDIKV